MLSLFDKNIKKLNKKYNNIALYKIIFMKSSNIKEKIFCIFYGAVLILLFIILFFLLIITNIFYKINKLCRMELGLDD